jgi:ribosomal protein RSM22 (predicted rRNA methylase)
MRVLNGATVSLPLLQIIAQLVEETRISRERLAQAVAELSHLFTKGRAALPPKYLDDASRRAGYLAYFLPVNLAKVQALLDELPTDALREPAGRPVSVLDVGSGPGTGALAVLDWLQGQRIPHAVEIAAVDQSQPALRDAERLFEGYKRVVGAQSAVLVPIKADLEKSRRLEDLRAKQPDGFDLILAANVLNEVGDDTKDGLERRTAFTESLLGLLAPNGSLIVMEPALRESSRNLLRVRDALLAKQACTVYSPCLHDDPCPALVKADDWCHEERPWTPPAIVAAIDKEVGFIKDALKFSYVMLRKDGRTIVPRRSDVYRVVSELREMKGEKRAWLCNETGRPEIGRQDRLRSETNAAMDEWHRGAIVRISEIVRKERKGRETTVGRIPAEATVEIIKSV